jgi:hypothetical protein
MAPLTSFLFTCKFRRVGNDPLFTDSVLKKLEYSVDELNIPKMKAMESDAVQYGSFFVTFPFFSTGEKEMDIDFYETDDMMISKIFYELQARNRWNAFSIYSNEQADLYADVQIHDMRNTLPYNQRILFENHYSIKLITFDPPSFERTNNVKLLKVKAKFNTLEGDYGTAKWRNLVNLDTGFDAEDEMNKTTEEGGLDSEMDIAVIDTKDLNSRMEAFSKEIDKQLNTEEQKQTPENPTKSSNDLDIAYIAAAQKFDQYDPSKKSITNDFKLDDNELLGLYRQFVVYKHGLGAKTMSFDEFKRMAETNIASLGKNVGEASRAIEEDLGLKIKVHEVSDPDVHKAGRIGATTHVIGAKADLHIYRDGKRVKLNDLSAEEVVKLQSILEANGLKANLEYQEGGAGIWIDAELKKALVDNIEGDVEYKDSSGRAWTGSTGQVVVKSENGDHKRDLVTGEVITGEENQKKRLRKMYDDAREAMRLKAAPAIKEQQDEMLKELRSMSEATSSRR